MASALMKEKVLCVERSRLPLSWLKEAGGVKLTEERFEAYLKEIPMCWRPRGEVEINPSFKQLIPYVILQTSDGCFTACYRRHGTEARLHDLWSVGIGGHINDADLSGRDTGLRGVLFRGMGRELREEFSRSPEKTHPVFHGIINEEKTDVGKVHMGLVYRIHVDDMDDFQPGEELCDFTWHDSESVFSRSLELWSHLALNLLDEDSG